MDQGISDFFAAWELFADPVWTGIAAGATLGVLGVYVVLRRMIFLSAAVSQASGLGVVLALFAQAHLGASAVIASPIVGAIVATFGALLWLWASRSHVDRDARLGVVFLVGMAGTLAVGALIPNELHDVDALLYGSAVAVLPEDMTRVVVLSVVTLLLHALWHRGFTLVSFDPVGAKVRGVPVRVADAILLVSLGLAIALITQVIGALPVFAFCVLPALAALQWASNPAQALVVAGLLGAFYGFTGYLGSFLWDLPVGAAYTLVAALGFAVSALLARLLRPRMTVQ
ncbi:MAG: zinc transport system permease protein [Myxococcota bacterium]|jgi:zinc transport system permease protein